MIANERVTLTIAKSTIKAPSNLNSFISASRKKSIATQTQRIVTIMSTILMKRIMRVFRVYSNTSPRIIAFSKVDSNVMNTVQFKFDNF